MALAEQSFFFFIPTISILGVGCSKEAGPKAKSLGFKKALLVTDAGLAKMGVADVIGGYLKAEGVDYVLYSGAEPNPTDINVRDGVKVWKDNGCDSLISLGGGSSHDCGKGIGLMMSNPGKDIRDFEGLDVSTENFVPYIAINTTAGTASEMTRFCIITNTDTHVKMAIVDWRVTAQVAIVDPVLMLGKPPALTAATGMDALTHAVEAYVSTIAEPITDACAIKAIELIAKSLRRAVALGSDLQARDDMAWAEFLAGMAFNNAGLGYVHAMAHQLGGFYNLPHGVCNAILLPAVEQYNLIAAPERFADIAKAMGVKTDSMSTLDAAQAAIDAIKQLSASIGIPPNLTVLGVKEADLKVMAENAKKDVCQLMNPRTATLDQVIDIFKSAM
ncbi:MAG: iron-containing alcohol dehydrogenase [Geobacteraceae bacterium]